MTVASGFGKRGGGGLRLALRHHRLGRSPRRVLQEGRSDTTREKHMSWTESRTVIHYPAQTLLLHIGGHVFLVLDTSGFTSSSVRAGPGHRGSAWVSEFGSSDLLVLILNCIGYDDMTLCILGAMPRVKRVKKNMERPELFKEVMFLFREGK